jgi:hypothetical protein
MSSPGISLVFVIYCIAVSSLFDRNRRSVNSSSPSSLRGFKMPCNGYDSRIRRAALILRGNGISRSEKRKEERDTIPKPVGLGMQLQNHNTNSHRTSSNAIRGCSRSVRGMSEEKTRRPFCRPNARTPRLRGVQRALNERSLTTKAYLSGESRPSLAGKAL